MTQPGKSLDSRVAMTALADAADHIAAARDILGGVADEYEGKASEAAEEAASAVASALEEVERAYMAAAGEMAGK